MKKPNILYMMSDDHAANSISCYGSRLSKVFKTPNMDRIAQEGVRLNNFFSTNSICTPARATVMTGQYGQVNGVRTLNDIWDPHCNVNLAKILSDNGYYTAMIGKWHLGCNPEGFDDYNFLEGGVNEKNIHKGQQGTYQNPTMLKKGDPEVIQHKGYVTDIINDIALDMLKNRDKSKPFFIMCNHKAPHDFWEYPERHEHLFDGVDLPVPDTLFEDKSHRCEGSRNFGSSVTPRSKVRSLYADFSKPDYVTGPLVCSDDMTFEQKGIAAYQKYLKDYLRTVKGVDDSVGDILAELEREGELDNTIVIYTSDQGMYLGEHDYQDKRWSFEEGLRAPMLIRFPKEIKAGSVEDHLMCNIDIAPTILDYAGIKAPSEMQGKSCRKMISGDYSGFVRDSVYFRYWMHLAHKHDNPAHYGLRTDKYKIIFYYGLPLDASGAMPTQTPFGWELYDLEKDPFEKQNQYNNPKYAQVVKDMKKKLDEAKVMYKDLDDKYPELVEIRKKSEEY